MAFALNKYTGTMDLINDPNTKIIQVSKNEAGVGFASIKEAMESVQPSPEGWYNRANAHVILVAPGTYIEETIKVKRFVNIVSLGGPEQTTIQCKKTSSLLFDFGTEFTTGWQTCGIHGFSLEANGTLAGVGYTTLINIHTRGSYYLSDIIMNECQTGLLINDETARVHLLNMKFGHTEYASEDVIKVLKGTLTCDIFNCSPSANADNLVTVTGTNSKAHIYNLKSESSDVVTGLFVDDSAKVTIISSDINHSTTALKIDNSGYIAARNCMFYESSDYDVCLSNGGKYSGHASCLNRDKIYNDGTGVLHSFGYDYSRKIFRSLADFSVGLPNQGHRCWFGKGGPYEQGVLAMTFDGSDYVDVTDSTTIQFPNNNVGTCIYFGETNLNDWYGLQYLMGTTKISGGAIEWQYYDETAGWIKTNILNTIDGYSDSYNGSSFIGDDGVAQSIRFDYNIKDGIIESDASATGWIKTTINDVEAKYVRCIITSAISQSPIFQLIRIKGSYTTIRENGTRSYNGEARSIKNITLPFGDAGSGGASATLDISSNISWPFWNNSLNDAGKNELYFRFILTEDVDTSSGLTFKYKVSTAYTGAADKLGKIKVYFSSVKVDDKFDGANTETVQDSNFVYTANEVANLAHTYTVSERLDISNMQEDDIIFVMIQRDGAHGDDNITDAIDFSNVWAEYHAWQDGKSLK